MTLLTLTESELLTGFLVFVRVLTLMTSNPLFGNRAIPVRLRVVFGIFLAIVILPAVPSGPPLTGGLWEMAVRVVQEIFFGLSLGLLLTLLFAVVSLSGQLIGTTSGLAMANLFDISQQSTASVVVSVKSMVLFLTFLALDFHHVIIRGMARSFVLVPPGSGTAGIRVGFYLARLFSTVFETALIIALPVVLVVFVVNLSMAIIARVAPQMNVFFSVGYQANENLALLLLALSLPMVVSVLVNMFGNLDQYMFEIIRQFQ